MTLLCDTSASVLMKAAVEAVDDPQLRDPASVHGGSGRVYNDGFSQLHMFEVDAHQLQRSAAKKVWSGSEEPQEPSENHI